MIRPRIFVQGVRAPWPVREVQRRWTAAALLVTWGILGLSTGAQAAQTVRMVCYNIEADVNGVTTPRAGLYTVLEAIGEQPYAGTAAQPLDLLALEETTSNGAATPSPGTGTVGPIVAALNSYYNGAATYALVPYQATEYNNDPTTGDGPNAMVYNTATLTLVYQNGAAAVGVAGTGVKSGGNTVYRQVPRYEFQPVNGAAGTNFYVYVCHMKSGASSTATNANDRTAEAKAIRADAATLPATANILYMGDFNMDGSAETAYQTLTATSTAAGQGIDPLNYPQNNAEVWSSATYAGLLTESATALDYRDDIQFLSPNVYNSTTVGLHYVPGSLHSFGNNGTLTTVTNGKTTTTSTYGQSVNQSSNLALNTLSGPITPAAALSALTTGSDHLPAVADYLVTTPYQAWQTAHFTAAELANPAISGDLADPDGDGVVNLLEYALGLDPKVAAVSGLPTGGTVTISGSQYLTLTYTQVIAATDLVYTPQVSGDLVTWSSGTGNVVAVGTTNNADGVTQTVVVRDATALGGGGRRFMRLMVGRQ